jgi:DnaJ-class molecular chaperone
MGVQADKQPAGDLLAEIEIVTPEHLTDSAKQKLEELAQELKPKNPRQELIW